MSEQPPSPERPPLTLAQSETLQDLCERYGVEYDPTHYTVYPPDSIMMPLWAEGYVGGFEIQPTTPTIYVGVSPEGQAHS